MSVKDEEFKTKIYDLMNGSYNLEEYPVAESSVVKDEFAEGKYCEKLYSQMLEAYERVCRRLGLPDTEDKDVEIIISNLMSIGRYQSMKMFDYGVLFTELSVGENYVLIKVLFSSLMRTLKVRLHRQGLRKVQLLLPVLS